MNRKPKQVMYRRKRSGSTHYRKRLLLLLSGKPRIVVRCTGQRILGQFITFTPRGDCVEAGVDSFSLRKFGWNSSCKNIPAAYLTGLWLGKKMAGREAILDVGFRTPLKGGRVFAFLQGALEGGLRIPHQPDKFPSPERIQGQHILVQQNSSRSSPQSLKSPSLSELPEQFAAVKEKLQALPVEKGKKK